jgi:hypothetical protein
MADQYTDLLRRELDAGRTPAELWVMAADLVRGGRLARADAETILGPEPPPAYPPHFDFASGPFSLPALPPPRPRPVKPPPPTSGPGTELTAIYASLGIEADPSCDCKAKAEQMDRWKVDGCRAHFWEIVGWQKDGAVRWGYAPKLKAAALAVATGLAFRVNWSDPFPGLVEEAIRRAAAKAGGG